MNQRLVDIRNENEQRSVMAKLAHIESVWGEDEVAKELLAETISEIEKMAQEGEFGEQEPTASEIIDMGVFYTNEALNKMAEEHEAEEESEESEETDGVEYTPEMDPDLQEKVAESYDVGLALGNAMRTAGYTPEDMQEFAKTASEEEQDQLGEFLAQLATEIFSEEA